MNRPGKQKPYFLSIDRQRELRRSGIQRPSRFVKSEEKVHRVLKEKTKLLAARISESCYNRLKFVLDDENPSALPTQLEKAIDLWMVEEMLGAKTLLVFFSSNKTQAMTAVLRRFKLKARGFKSSKGAYRVNKNLTLAGAKDVLGRRCTFPKHCRPEKQRAIIQEILGHCDIGIMAYRDSLS